MKVATQLTDAELVRLFAEGDESAFNVLLGRYKNKVFSAIRHMVHDRAVAEDIFQDVFLKVIIKLREKRYVEDGKFAYWLLRMAHNLCIDHIRKMKNRQKAVFDDEDQALKAMEKALVKSEKSNSSLADRSVKETLRNIVRNLPEAQREVFILRNLVGFSFKEIAEYQGVSINTAIGRMRYAILAIKKQLNNDNVAYDKNFYP